MHQYAPVMRQGWLKYANLKFRKDDLGHYDGIYNAGTLNIILKNIIYQNIELWPPGPNEVLFHG